MSRLHCKAFEKDGYCRFGDACKNLHIGFTVCDLCGVEIEELTEEVNLAVEETKKEKEKVKEKAKGPVNVFAFLDDSSSDDDSSNSDSDEDSEKEDEKVVEVANDLTSTTLGGDNDDDFETVDVKATRQVVAVKERIIQSAMCCKGGRIDVRTSHQSKESVTDFLNNKAEWKVGEAGEEEEWSLPEGMEELLTETPNSQEVEVAMLTYLHNMQREDIEENTVQGYSSQPWSLCASDMKDHKTMLECFSLHANVSHGSAGAGSAAVGNIFHAILDDAAAAVASEGATGSSKLGDHWSSAEDSVIDVKDIGLKIHGCSDALFKGMPVELKTVSNLKMLKDVQKVRGWLNQVAVYQCADTTAAILLIIARDTFELKAYEVNVSNIAQAVTLWQEIFESDPFLRSLMVKSNEYSKAVEVWKETRFTQNAPNKCFLHLLAEVPQLFGNEILSLSNKCKDALLDKETYRESCHFYKEARRLNMRSGNKKLKKRLFDDEESIEELYKSLDKAIQEKAEELYQQMIQLCPLLYADFSTYELDVLTEAIELGRLSAEMYETLLGMQNAIVPPMRAHILKLKTAAKAKKGDDEEDDEDDDEKEGDKKEEGGGDKKEGVEKKEDKK
jgi:hypothetical protein